MWQPAHPHAQMSDLLRREYAYRSYSPDRALGIASGSMYHSARPVGSITKGRHLGLEHKATPGLAGRPFEAMPGNVHGVAVSAPGKAHVFDIVRL